MLCSAQLAIHICHYVDINPPSRNVEVFMKTLPPLVLKTFPMEGLGWWWVATLISSQLRLLGGGMEEISCSFSTTFKETVETQGNGLIGT